MDELYELLGLKSLGDVYTEGGQLEAGQCELWSFYVGSSAVPEEDFRTDDVEWIRIGASKDPGKFNVRGAGPKRVNYANMTKAKMGMFRIDNEMVLPISVMDMLREPDQHAYQDMGISIITEQLRRFGSYAWYNKYATLSKMLSAGEMFLDEDGDILESSSGSAREVDWGVSAHRKLQLAKLGNKVGASGNIIDTAWDDVSAKIMSHLDTIREAADATNTELPRHVWLHTVAKEWFRNNTQIKSFYSGIDRLDKDIRSGAFELEGFVFHFTAQGYTAADGTHTPFVPKTGAIITPDPGPWMRKGRGRELVAPLYSKQGVAGDGVQALLQVARSLIPVMGDFATVNLLRSGGAQAILEAGANYVYYLKNPDAVFMPTVDF